MDESVIDLDEPTTWAEELNAVVRGAAERLRGEIACAEDLNVTSADEDGLDAALTGHRLLVFHCTRLLAHEDEMMRSQGLRTLSRELVSERIEAAFSHGVIDEDEHAAFHSSHVFAAHEHGNRENATDVIVGTNAFVEHGRGCNPLLSIWGGEAMYMSTLSVDETRLRQLGRPAILVGHFHYDPSRVASYCRGRLANVFVRRYLDLQHVSTQLRLREGLAPAEIADIWHPGDPNYDRFGALSCR